MQVKSIAECSKGSILQYFRPSLSYHILFNPFDLSVFKGPLKTGFTVVIKIIQDHPLSSDESKRQRRHHLVRAYENIDTKTIDELKKIYEQDFIFFSTIPIYHQQGLNFV